jgi:acylpyruvate hydrolase
MRYLTFRTAEGVRVGRLDGNEVIDVAAGDIGSLLARGADWRDRVDQIQGRRYLYDDLAPAPLVIAPSKIICLGLNYMSHIEELGRPRPKSPTIFAKFARALVGARDPIRLPVVSEQLDWEAELAFVIGKKVRNVSPVEGGQAIAGFTIVNDVSARDWQWQTTQWLQGKTFEGTTPLGPMLVTPDEAAGARDLTVRCEVDGEVVQEANTSDLLFKPEEIVSFVSQIVTLDPGDVISTGTPGGIGAARTPPRFLEEGQVVRTSIEMLGECVNRCVRDT